MVGAEQDGIYRNGTGIAVERPDFPAGQRADGGGVVFQVDTELGEGVGLCGEVVPFSGWLLDEMKGEL